MSGNDLSDCAMQSGRARYKWPLLLAIAVGLCAIVIRALWIWRYGRVVEDEGAAYASIARGLLSGAGYVETGGGRFDLGRLILPPLIALIAPITGSIELAARAVSLVAGVALIAPASAIARRIGGAGAALLAALLIATNGLMVSISASTSSAALFVFLSLSAIALILNALQRHTFAAIASAVVVCGLAVLTRPAIGALLCALILVAVAAGLTVVARKVAARVPGRALISQVTIGAIAVLALSFLSLRVLPDPGERSSVRTAESWKSAGIWIEAQGGARPLIMGFNAVIPYYARADLSLFSTNDNETTAIGRLHERRPDYVVLTSADGRTSPLAKQWFEHGIPDKCATEVKRFDMSVRRSETPVDPTVAVFRWTCEPHAERHAAAPSDLAPSVRTVSGPLRRSTQNPRYFADAAGQPVYLTGSHNWSNLQDWGPMGHIDYDKYLAFMKAHRHNFMRLWVIDEAANIAPGGQFVFIEPMPYQRTGPGLALDGRPRFDLTRYNPEYFERLRAHVAAANEQGIYVAIMLFNGISNFKPWRWHPYNGANNVNGIDGDPNHDGVGAEAQTLQIPALLEVQKKYVAKVIDTVGDFDHVLWEISNESGPTAREWQYEMIRFIKEYESRRGKSHPVGMTVEPEAGNPELWTSPADWISPNWDGVGGDYRDSPPVANGEKVVVTDTDHLWGIGGTQAWVWKSFTRGLYPIFMDPYETISYDDQLAKDASRPDWEAVRRSLGYTSIFAERLDLALAVPHGELVSSGYCLANPGEQYLVYVSTDTPPHPWREEREVSIDLSGVAGSFTVEWFDPGIGKTLPAGTLEGGGRRTLRAPFRGDAVLYLERVKPDRTRTSTAGSLQNSSTAR